MGNLFYNAERGRAGIGWDAHVQAAVRCITNLNNKFKIDFPQ
jgi:hypothetical protein